MTSKTRGGGTVGRRSACPACGFAAVRVGPASRATGRRIARCPRCRVHYWSNADDVAAQSDAGGDVMGATAQSYSDWVGIKREQAGPAAWRDTAAWLRDSVVSARTPDGDTVRPRLFDVGAGDGHFLQIARDEFGFDVLGNDVVPGAVTLADQEHGVTLELGDLAVLHHDSDFDAVTLWCVLAHVPDGADLVGQVRTMLRPGGVIALQTPHWTVADAAAHALQRLSRGRFSRITDRRIAEHHRVLHTRRSITMFLERSGFTDVSAEPQQRYTLTSYAYLASMNPPRWILTPAMWLLDLAVRLKLAPRIVLDVRARRR